LLLWTVLKLLLLVLTLLLQSGTELAVMTACSHWLADATPIHSQRQLLLMLLVLLLLLRFLGVVLQQGGRTEALVGGVCWLLLLQLHTEAKALQILLA
jgi:hypothetical protein